MSEWIKCVHRMPADLQSCIVARGLFMRVSNMYWDEANNYWMPDGYGFNTNESYTDVTHWMPMPDPPTN